MSSMVIVDTDQKVCAAPDCRQPVKPPARKWHARACYLRTWRRLNSGKYIELDEQPEVYEPVVTPDNARRGEVLAQIIQAGWADKLAAGDMSHTRAAEMLGVDQSSISRAVAGYVEDMALHKEAEGWEMDPADRELLGLDVPRPQRDHYPNKALWDQALDEYLETMVDLFARFRSRFFHTRQKSTGDLIPYYTEDFHLEWIKETLRALMFGGRLQIMSPPRHGKTELLIAFCVWLICRDPNIAIVWIGGNDDIAEQAVGAVKDILERNRELVTAYTPPGLEFKPLGRSKQWANKGFTVATRTVVGQKAPTMYTRGRGGKLLSLDVDLMVVDDPEDHKSTLHPGGREATRTWMFTSVESRKEEWTAQLVIGSRQHFDDLYGYILDDPEWRHIVNSAHDEACTLDPYDHDLHYDCMLFPQLRSHKFIMGKKRSAESQGQGHLFEMVYLNRPRPEGMQIFTNQVVEQCFNRTRGLGIEGLEVDHLVGGLDPSDTGHQAAFLWGYRSEHLDERGELVLDKLSMVDINNRLGGGARAALEIIRLWHEKYGLSHWVIEKNLYRGGIINDDSIQAYANANGIYIEPHETHLNKWDDWYGVTAMEPRFAENRIDLPYGDPDAQYMSQLYRNQLVTFSEKANASKSAKAGVRSDIVMASWFPMKVIRRFAAENMQLVTTLSRPTFSGYRTLSYPGAAR